MAIIGSIIWNPREPAAGQSVKIDVCGPNGKPYANKQSDYVGINGVAGSEQYLQFPFPGDQKVLVNAMSADGTQEQSAVTITVVPNNLSPATQAILSDPANSALTKRQIAWLKSVADINLLTVAPLPPYDSPYHVAFRLLPLSKFVPPPLSKVPLPTASMSKSTTPLIDKSYVWSFGDGSGITTQSPSVTHDYKAALNTTDEFQQFHVEVEGTKKGSGTWTRTLSVHNAYVACKKQGYVIPEVRVGEWATKVGTNFVGTAVIKNSEPVPITLVSRVLIPVLENSDTMTVPTRLEAVVPPIVVPAKGSVKVQVVAPFAHVPVDALGFSAVFTDQPVVAQGISEFTSIVLATEGKLIPGVVNPTKLVDPIAGLKIRATANFLVQPQYRGVTAPQVGSFDAANPLENLNELTTTLENLDIAATTPIVSYAPIEDYGPLPDPIPQNEIMPPVAVGNQCDPDNLPENVPANLACQVTPQSQKIVTNARFLNARKGDVVLCPSVGTGSLVDGIFTVLIPPQLYGHSGIMTRNYEQITHCTASQDRMEAYKVGNWLSSEDEGLDPEVCKYGWPGVLTQTVDHAVNGEMIADPTGSLYHFQDFLGTPSAIYLGNIGTSPFVVIPPRVVKPDPLLETTAVRKALTKVADDAYAGTGKFHYRFYCFTNPAANLVAPTGLGSASAWAVGTRAAVCSSFIWMMMKGRRIKALGPSEYATSGELGTYAKQQLQVQLDPNGLTLDGLFYYSEQQRLTGGVWLYDAMYNLVASQAGTIGEIITGAGGAYANQLCNTFADDRSDLAGFLPVGQPWETPGDANAVSPDNLLAWNGPGPQGGVLGYSEPIIYLPRSVATVPIYKWAKVTHRGTITGHVYLNNRPARDVTVELPNMITGTDSNGGYKFGGAPYGPYLVEAKKQWVSGPVVDGIQTGVPRYATGQASVNLDKASVVAPDIHLNKPDEPYNRTVAIKGYASMDCSSWPNHYEAFPLIEGWVYVGIGYANGTWSQVETCHSQTVTFSAWIGYQPDESVSVFVIADMDEPGGRSIYGSFNVPPGQAYTFVIGNKDSFLNGRNGYFYNGGGDLEAYNDTMCCSITFSNNEWSG